jgi:hypothetical protein
MREPLACEKSKVGRLPPPFLSDKLRFVSFRQSFKHAALLVYQIRRVHTAHLIFVLLGDAVRDDRFIAPPRFLLSVAPGVFWNRADFVHVLHFRDDRTGKKLAVSHPTNHPERFRLLHVSPLFAWCAA